MVRFDVDRVADPGQATGYDPGMTRRVTVSLPDDVAAYLDTEDNASAAVADALRARRRRGEATLALLRATGFDITQDDVDRNSGTVPRLTQPQRAESRRRLELLVADAWDDDADATADPSGPAG
jgi:hypothetical protein